MSVLSSESRNKYVACRALERDFTKLKLLSETLWVWVFFCQNYTFFIHKWEVADQSINQSIQKVLTRRRGQHCTNNNST